MCFTKINKKRAITFPQRFRLLLCGRYPRLRRRYPQVSAADSELWDVTRHRLVDPKNVPFPELPTKGLEKKVPQMPAPVEAFGVSQELRRRKRCHGERGKRKRHSDGGDCHARDGGSRCSEYGDGRGASDVQRLTRARGVWIDGTHHSVLICVID